MGRALSEIAALLEGDVVGDASIEITGAAPLKDAVAGDLTLLDTSRNLSKLQGTHATAVVVSNPFEELKLPRLLSRMRIKRLRRPLRFSGQCLSFLRRAFID